MVYNDLEKVITNSKYIHRHIVPFSFSPNGNVNEYNRIFMLLNRSGKFELCTDIRNRDSDVYEYLHTLYNNDKEKINKESIGSVWNYKKSEEEQKAYYIFQEKKEAPIKLLARISNAGMYLLKTGIGLLWYEIRYYKSKELMEEIESFERWIRKTKEEGNIENKIKVLEEQYNYLQEKIKISKQVEEVLGNADNDKIIILKNQYESLQEKVKSLKNDRNKAKQIKNDAESKLDKIKVKYKNLHNQLKMLKIEATEEADRIKDEEETLSILKKIEERDVEKAILTKDEIEKIEEIIDIYKSVINYLLETLNFIKIWDKKIENGEDVNEEIEKFRNQCGNLNEELEIIAKLEPEKEKVLQNLTKGSNEFLKKLKKQRNKILERLEKVEELLENKKQVTDQVKSTILEDEKQEELLKTYQKFEGIIINSFKELEKLICLKELEEGGTQKTKEDVKDLTVKYEQIKKDKIKNLKNLLLGLERDNALDIKNILDFQNMFKELARSHTEIKYMDNKGNLKEAKSCVLGKWVADVLENLGCGDQLEYFPKRTIDKDSPLYSLRKTKKANVDLVDIETIGGIPDKAILYNYVAIREEDIEASGYKQESKNVLETMAYYMALGYNQKYEMAMHIRDNMLHPYDNIVEFVKKEGYAECIMFNQENKEFFIEHKFTNMRTDYFHMYMNLLQQSYSVLSMSKELATSLPSNHETYQADEKNITKKLEEMETRINLFLIKSVKASVSHVENQNEFYSYVEKGLHIREDIAALRDGVGTLEEIMRRHEKKEKDAKSGKIQNIFSLLTIISLGSLYSDLIEFSSNMSKSISEFSEAFILIVFFIIVVVVFANCRDIFIQLFKSED